MKIIQGTIPLNLDCHFVRENKKLVGLSFYKNDSVTFSSIVGAIICLIVSWICFKFESFFFLVFLAISIISIMMAIESYKKQCKKVIVNNRVTSYVYRLDEITDVKIIEKTTMMATEKKTMGTLGGAGVGGALFGGAGAVVGALSSGNNIRKEKDTSLGIGFIDKNWVVIEFTTNTDTVVGRLYLHALNELLEVTSSKQEKPF